MRHRHAVARGFTLIELLVVLTIITIIVAVAVLSLGDRSGNEGIAAEARRLAALIELARERAQLDASEYGLDVHPDGYRFVQYDEVTGTWLPSRRAVLRQRALPAGMRMDVKVDAQTLPPTNAQPASGATGPNDAAMARQAAQPEVLMLSSGEVSNFRVVLTSTAKGALAWNVGSDGVATVRAASVAQDSR